MNIACEAEASAASIAPGRRNIAARRDAAWVVAISAAAALCCVKFDLSEVLLGWTRRHERLQLDELPGVLLVMAVCLAWFASRRYFEARRQLEMRRVMEGRLADALADNQRLAQQYVLMQEAERKALARDLHDELGQYLHVIKLDAVSVRDAILGGARASREAVGSCAPGSCAAGSCAAAASAVIDNVDRVYAVVANLIRQLRPAGFDELGLAAALESCVDDWRRRLAAATINLSIEDELADLDENRGLAVFRLVQEAMTNMARHSQATRVDIRIVRRRESAACESIDVSITDDGRGADLAAPRAGLGLIGMRERVAAFGGTVRLLSHPGAGFEVFASVPYS